MIARQQQTIGKPVSVTGKGLHTGLPVTLTLHPAPVNHGYVFRRVDLESKPLIHALAEFVTDTSRGTTLVENGAKVSTIEHVLAALTGMSVDNALLEINGPEAPIMDGSSALIVKAIHEAGVVKQDAPCEFYVVKEPIEYNEPERGVSICIYPADHFSADVMIDYNSKVLGSQYASLSSISDFEQEVSMCRTFVFLHEVEALFKHNLIKGGDLQNAIVIAEKAMEPSELSHLAELFNMANLRVKPEGVLNNLELHYNNEPARHKLLDLVGDLSLIGMPIVGRVVARRPGHLANTELAKHVRQLIRKESAKARIPVYNPMETPVYDINGIKNILPHRIPMLLVDKIIHLDERSVVGVKNVTMNEPFFMGHFPDEPVMPGVLQIEAMAQVGGILALSTVPDPEHYSTYFLKIDKVRFKKKVVPGDTLILKLELTEDIRRGIVMMFGQAYVGETLVSEGELMAQIIKNKA